MDGSLRRYRIYDVVRENPVAEAIRRGFSYNVFSVTQSLVALVVANALPLVGVLFLSWTVFPLVLLYWLENVVVGGFNVAKLLLAQPRQPVYWLGKAFLVPFFPVAFGGVTYIHCLLLGSLVGSHNEQPVGLLNPSSSGNS